MRILLAAMLVTLLVRAPSAAAEARAETSLAGPHTLAPDTAPEIPMPEPALGPPLPENPAAAALDALIEQISRAGTPTPGESEPTPDARREQNNRLFAAIDEGDSGAVRSLLAGGADPNAEVPSPLEDTMLDRFRKDFLLYYVTKESGLTPLMFAAARGHRDIVELLLAGGAEKNARTKRHGTDALWLAGYAGHVDVIQFLLGVEPGSEADRTLVEIDLSSQTASLTRDSTTVSSVPISSGKRKFETPTGEYVVTNKHRHWKSTLYGSSMPFYLRLSCRDFGLHAGHLPGYPASHGCIRLHRQDAAEFFKQIPVGSKVVIK
ncbi:MAG: L,D-transpeptidase family protein [Chthoniobacterales bacterium]